jgi:hypothetical protein
MSQPTVNIARDVDAALTSAKWPQGRSVEQALLDIEAVLKLMTAKLTKNKIGACFHTDATDPGPHQIPP